MPEQTVTVQAEKQEGLSPKVALPFITAIVGWLITKVGLDLDADAAAAIVLALLTLAGVVAKPGKVRGKVRPETRI